MATQGASRKQSDTPSESPKSKTSERPSADPEMSHLIEQGRVAREDARTLADDVGKVVETASAMARAQLDRNLYGTLLAAAGIGYVLGGGLPTRILALGATLAMRQASARAIGEAVSRMQDGMAQASPEGDS